MAAIKCFVSFCEVDGNVSEIAVLVDELSNLTRGNVNFLCSFNLEIGGDIKAHESTLDLDCDACLIIGTPEYKKRADGRQLNSGVSREYQSLLRRLDASNSTADNPPPPLRIIPIIWKGTFESSIPFLFENRQKAADLSRFITYEVNGIRRLANDARRYTSGDIEYIAKSLSAIATASTPSEEARKTAYREFDLTLFTGKKREREIIPEYNERVFIKTRQYIRVLEQDEFLLVGRKGVGKTTLITGISEHEQFRNSIDVIVDEWKIHGVAARAFQRTAASDLLYIQKDSAEAFKLLWSAFIFLEILRSAFTEHDRISLGLCNEAGRKYLSVERSRGLASQFVLSSEVVSKFIQEIVDNSPTENQAQFDAYLESHLDVDHLLVWLAGNSDTLARIYRVISGQRHVFCVDGFDNKFQEARNEAQISGLEQRVRIVKSEVDWLTALVEVVEHIKKPTRRSGMKSLAGMRSLAICVALPKDRFLEVQRARRDSIMAGGTREFRWTGMELASLLRKRLEFSGRFDTKRLKINGSGLRDRLEEALRQYAPELCCDVQVVISNRSFIFDLFLEVLRHTFWRPRDVLIHYAEMLAVIKSNSKLKKNTLPNVLSAVIARTNNIIIQDEWIDEVKHHITNIESVIGSFKNGSQILDYNNTIRHLADVDFIFMHQTKEYSPEMKMGMLYELGFFGTRKKRPTSGGQRMMSDVFYHVYPDHVDFSETGFGSSVYILIHPIFIERLNLDPSGERPVLNLDWDSIELHDAMN